MNIVAEKLDQSDITACTRALEIEATSLETKLKASGQSVPARPAKAADCIAAYYALESHVAKLRVQSNLTPRPTPATLPPSPANPAAGSPKSAVSPVSLQSPRTFLVPIEGKPGAFEVTAKNPNATATEKLLAAHGVESVEALAQKKRARNTRIKQTGLAN